MAITVYILAKAGRLSRPASSLAGRMMAPSFFLRTGQPDRNERSCCQVIELWSCPSVASSIHVLKVELPSLPQARVHDHDRHMQACGGRRLLRWPRPLPRLASPRWQEAVGRCKLPEIGWPASRCPRTPTELHSRLEMDRHGTHDWYLPINNVQFTRL